jgi:ubiquinone/menaquinone biosynthesis C-methylase UbiE
MTLSAEQVAAGYRAYTPHTLKIYDWLVMGVSNHFVWRCPTKRIVALFNDYVTANHLDVGVGTGYFLDRCTFPSERPRLGLLDMNSHCLEVAATRVARYHPEIYQVDVLEPISRPTERFDSVSCNYVLHCLPGSWIEKGRALTNLAALLNPGGVLFGATLLHGVQGAGRAAGWLMDFYNRQRIFSNRTDDVAGLAAALEPRFSRFSLDVVGCAALFAARAD